jgi:hypothetical protein
MFCHLEASVMRSRRTSNTGVRYDYVAILLLKHFIEAHGAFEVCTLPHGQV